MGPKTAIASDTTITTSSNPADTAAGLKGLPSTMGPLTRRVAETANVPTSSIPLLGDAAPGDVQESSMKFEARQVSTDPIALALNLKIDKVWIPIGALTTEAANDGPAYWDDSTDRVKLIAKPSTVLDTQMACDSKQNCGQPTGPTPNAQGQTGVYAQDTRDWYSVHGGGTKGSSCNILMADGSVKTFIDANGDGFLNPGFPVNGLTDDEIDSVGYQDQNEELPRGEMFNGVMLFRLTKGKLEQ